MFGLGLIALIVGVVLWVATSLVTLGVVLTIIGGILIAINLVFVLIALGVAVAVARASKPKPGRYH